MINVEIQTEVFKVRAHLKDFPVIVRENRHLALQIDILQYRQNRLGAGGQRQGSHMYKIILLCGHSHWPIAVIYNSNNQYQVGI